MSRLSKTLQGHLRGTINSQFHDLLWNRFKDNPSIPIPDRLWIEIWNKLGDNMENQLNNEIDMLLNRNVWYSIMKPDIKEIK